MFKDIQSVFSKFFTPQKIILFLILIVLGYFLFTYSSSKSLWKDGMGDGQPVATPPQSQQPPSRDGAPLNQKTGLQSAGQNVIVPNTQSIYKLKTVANPSDLLPQDKNSQWGTLNPTLDPNNVIIPDLLEAGYHIGLDTISSTLRNANRQERSDPIIPKNDNAFGGVLMSTVEPDLGRVPLEISSGCR